jgi:hypothetical protein
MTRSSSEQDTKMAAVNDSKSYASVLVFPAVCIFAGKIVRRKHYVK